MKSDSPCYLLISIVNALIYGRDFCYEKNVQIAYAATTKKCNIVLTSSIVLNLIHLFLHAVFWWWWWWRAVEWDG